jgi:hypothetical protein
VLNRRPVISHGGGHNHDGHVCGTFEDRSVHLRRCANRNHLHARRRRKRRGTADQDDAGAPASRGFGQRVTHLARGAICDVSDRVDVLAGGAGRNQDCFSFKVMTDAQRLEHGLHNGFGAG